METLKFKTDIQCGGCMQAVKPHLNKLSAIKQWDVDTQHEDKIMIVEGENLSAEEIVAALDEAGFSAQAI